LYGSSIFEINNTLFTIDDDNLYVLDDADARRWCKVPLNLTSTFNKKCIWTDGNNIYYSDLLEHHIFDMNNKRWIAIDWSCPCAVNIVPGSVWNKEDGTYYSKGATYKFNSTTKEWEKFKFKGYTQAPNTCLIYTLYSI
jgi:hypothetical protein